MKFIPNRLETKMVLLYYDVRTKDCQGYLETRVSPWSGRTSTVAKKEINTFKRKDGAAVL